MAMKICFETFGCRLNRAEALNDEARYLAAGHERTESHADADVIVVRGCSVTARAQKDCEKLIAHLRRKYPLKKVVVTGCLKSEKSDVPPSVEQLEAPPVPTRTARAYLKVQDGCDCQCAFCIVPQFRGKSASVPFDDALDEARRFLDAGYRELVVTGCNLSLYLSGTKRLPELVAALAELSPAARVRLGSVEPGAVAADVVKVMDERANVCRFLHLSVQSGSDQILSAMKRPYRVKDVDTLVNETTRRMPTLGLGCDIIAGFPGEAERDFQATKSLLCRHPFSNVHVFPFSERPGTPAEKLPGAVAESVRSSRAHALADIVADKRRLFMRQFIGRDVTVVVEDENRRRGWTGEYLPCEVMHRGNCAAIRRRDLVSAKVVDVRRGTLVAVQNS